MDLVLGLSGSTLANVAIGFSGGLLIAFIIYFIQKSRLDEDLQKKHQQAELESSHLINSAELEAKNKASEIIDKARKKSIEIEQSSIAIEREAEKKAAAIEVESQNLKNEKLRLSEESQVICQKQSELKDQIAENSRLQSQLAHKLEELTGMELDQVKESFISEARQEAESEAVALTQKILNDAKEEADDKAKKIIAVAIQRYSGEYTFDSTSATVSLPSADIKGRIIGREGRNIRAFEMATGITVLIDDTPNAVVLSGFDPVRREIARTAMQKLIEDGRIHPTRIEEVVEKSREEIEQVITSQGYEAQQKVQVPHLNKEVTHLLGKLKFRLSYSQNILDHSIEVAHICGILAAELGCDVKIAKLCGLLHDIGKAINHEKEGGHAIVGADFLKEQGLSDEVVNGVASHHFEVEPIGPYGILVSAADAISAARPGARSESLNTYLSRIEALEKLADSFPGIKKSYAVHAGREVRVLANAEELSDEEAQKLAKSLARAIEDQLQYPGQIRVTVIRETRCVEVAK